MLKISDGKIGSREFAAIMILSLGIKCSDTTPDILIFTGKNATWLLALVSALVLVLPLFTLMWLIKKHNLGLIELSSRLMGKWLGAVIVFIIFAIFFSTTISNSRSYIDIVSTMFYQKTPIPLLTLLLLFVSYLIAKLGIEAIGRTCWIVMFYFFAEKILLIVFVWQELDWAHLFPIIGPGVPKIATNGTMQSGFLVEVMLLATLFPFIRSNKDFRKGTTVGFATSVIVIVLYFALYSAAFDYPAMEYLNYPFQQLSRLATGGGTITHLESLFLGFWIIAAVVHFSIYIYTTTFLFGKVLRISQYERLLIPITGLTLFIGIIPDNIVRLNLFRNGMIKISSAVIIILPFLLLLFHFWKGRKSH